MCHFFAHITFWCHLWSFGEQFHGLLTSTRWNIRESVKYMHCAWLGWHAKWGQHQKLDIIFMAPLVLHVQWSDEFSCILLTRLSLDEIRVYFPCCCSNKSGQLKQISAVISDIVSFLELHNWGPFCVCFLWKLKLSTAKITWFLAYWALHVK